METFETTRRIAQDLIKSGYTVAVNKRNTLGLPIFHSRGVGASKPDILAINENYNEELYNPNFIPKSLTKLRGLLIETKTGDHYGELLNGIYQVIRYYTQFITDKSVIEFNGKRIYNLDAFLLATNWSPTGSLYKGDDDFAPLPINYISEKYNILIPPRTISLHSTIRHLQNSKRKEIKDLKLNIPRNKYLTQTGIMIAKIPYKDENSPISEEYYAWMGQKILPVLANSIKNSDWIKISLKLFKISEKAILAETKNKKTVWIPKSQLNLSSLDNKLEIGKPYEVEISLWFYKKRNDLFGIS